MKCDRCGVRFSYHDGHCCSNPINRQKAYVDGAQAAEDGKHAANCPYDYDSEIGKAWIAGFEDHGGKQPIAWTVNQEGVG